MAGIYPCYGGCGRDGGWVIRGKIFIVIWVNLNTESEALGKRELLVVFRKLAKLLLYRLVQEFAKQGWLEKHLVQACLHPASVPPSAK